MLFSHGKLKSRYLLLNLLVVFWQRGLAQNIAAVPSVPSSFPSENSKKHTVEWTNAAFYNIGERSIAYGIAIRYVQRVPNTKVGLGMGYERIWDAHHHTMLGIVGSYSPTDRLFLSIIPGLSYNHSPSNLPKMGIHLETVYNKQWKIIYLGPAVEWGFSEESYHFSMGIKAGCSF